LLLLLLLPVLDVLQSLQSGVLSHFVVLMMIFVVVVAAFCKKQAADILNFVVFLFRSYFHKKQLANVP